LPEDHFRHANLIDQHEAQRPKTVRARHAASLIVYRIARGETEMLMGMRGKRHVFMPNRLVFPGGRVDAADLSTPAAVPLAEHTARHLRRQANEKLAHGLGVAAARELLEETGLSLGEPARLGGLWYLARAVTPPNSPIRYNARFLVVSAEEVSGELGGDGELDNLRYFGMREAMELDLAVPTRRVLERLQVWLEMSEQQRVDMIHTPVLKKDKGWVME
jgi:8-oxo-dGTP pyrophosphatase MutT (NUDIX family)